MKIAILLVALMVGVAGCSDPAPADPPRTPHSYRSGHILGPDNAVIGQWEMVFADNVWSGDFRFRPEKKAGGR